jgi:hypothetical protein
MIIFVFPVKWSGISIWICQDSIFGDLVGPDMVEGRSGHLFAGKHGSAFVPPPALVY